MGRRKYHGARYWRKTGHCKERRLVVVNHCRILNMKQKLHGHTCFCSTNLLNGILSSVLLLGSSGKRSPPELSAVTGGNREIRPAGR